MQRPVFGVRGGRAVALPGHEACGHRAELVDQPLDGLGLLLALGVGATLGVALLVLAPALLWLKPGARGRAS